MPSQSSSELALAALLRGAGEFAVQAGQTSWAPALEHLLSAALGASALGAPARRALDLARDSCDLRREAGGELLAYSWRLAGGQRTSGTPAARVRSPLAAIFDGPQNTAQAELPLVPLDQYLAGAATSPATTIAGLFERFAAAISALQPTDLAALTQSLLTALETFGWCVPATGYDDVSIFELARTAAAIAAALAAQPGPAPSDFGKTNLMLAVGDLGGIQRFLYAVVISKAARMLRGRSLGLQLIADAIANRILEHFALPVSNLLYSGGGKLWLLMPAAAREELLSLGEHIDLELNQRFASRLSFGLGCAVIPASELSAGVSGLWERAVQNLAQGRRRRFARLMRARYEQLFEPFGEGSQACRVCGVLSGDLQPLSPENDERTRLACRECRNFVELGNAATRARIVIREAGGALTAQAQVRYEAGGYQYLLFEDAAGASPARSTTMWIDGPPLRWNGAGGQTMWLAGLNRAVSQAGRTLDFDELANNSEGIARLGILRMDVDSLGRIFSEGLGGGANFARIAALSRHLSYFFGAHLSHLVATEAYRDKVQVIYSGGDDLFLVGAWSEIPLVAQRIRDGFTSFTAANRNWGISAGIDLMPASFPIAAAAQRAGDAEERAKQFQRPHGKSKDAVCFLDEVLGWEDFAALTQARDQLYDLFGGPQPRLPRATLRTLHAIACEARAAGALDEQFRVDEATQAVRRGKWAWQAAYAVARATGAPQDRERLYQLYRSLANHQWNGIKQPLRLLKPAAEWVDLLKREKSK
jgi:CRISPR-associated protein Csm1